MTQTGEESLGKSVIHADLYDLPIYSRLLQRLIKARFLARSEMKYEPKYVVLTTDEEHMFRVFGTRQIPEKIYGLTVITQEEVIFP